MSTLTEFFAATPAPEPASGSDVIGFWILGAVVVVIFGGMVVSVLRRNRLKK